jgi:hypothetical protein
VGPDSKLTIHRGDKSGPTVARANACLVTPGTTDIHLTDPLHTVELEHILYPDSSKTTFTIDGKTYHWKGHAELLEDETQLKIAHFYPSWLVSDVKEHKLGKLIIYKEDLVDLVVLTALVVQERSDEGRQAVYSNNVTFSYSVDRDGEDSLYGDGYRGSLDRCSGYLGVNNKRLCINLASVRVIQKDEV